MPPVIRTVPLGVERARDARTTLPTFLPSLRWRKASGARRMSQAVDRRVAQRARLEERDELGEHLLAAVRAGSTRSNAR